MSDLDKLGQETDATGTIGIFKGHNNTIMKT